MTRYIVRYVLIITLIMVGTETAAFASSGSSERGRTLSIDFTTVGPVPQVSPPYCAPDGECVVSVLATTTTVTGDLEGNGYHAGTAGIVGDRIAGSSTSLFVGTIKGCGTGAFVTAGPFSGTLSDIKYGKGKVLLGTGDFEAMTGTGTSRTANDEGGTVTSQGRLRIKCPR